MSIEISDERIFDGGWLTQDKEGLTVRLETKDLELRSVSENDKPHYQALYSDPATMQMYTDNEKRLKEMDLAAWKQQQMENVAKRMDIWIQRWKDGIPFGAFAIYHQGEFVGHIIAGFGDNPGESEVAYIISNKHWKKGFASQAVEMVVQKWMPYLCQKRYETAGDNGGSKVVSVVVATSRIDNEWSNRILVKNGFTKTAENEAWGCRRNVYQKNILVS